MAAEKSTEILDELGRELELFFWRGIAHLTAWLYLHRRYKSVIWWGVILYFAAFVVTLMGLPYLILWSNIR